MTKTVRIENADTNNAVKVVVEVWDKGVQTENTGTADTLAQSVELAYPTRQCEFGITSTRYLVIREEPA